jgi:hypothetical protein
MKRYFETHLGDELRAAGLGEGLSWSQNEIFGRETLSPEDQVKLDAVIAAHNSNRPPPVRVETVSAAQAVVALEHTGILEAVEAVVAAYPKTVRLWYAKAQEWKRYNPYVMGIALELDLSDADVDQLFAYASTLDR